jgi:predicted amidophosphoribosyltransferase
LISGKFLYGVLILVWVVMFGLFLMDWIRQGKIKSMKRKRRSRRGKRCPNCQNLIDAKREVCQHCGYEFPPQEKLEKKSHSSRDRKGKKKKSKRGKRCPGCGNTIDYSREVCHHCGYKFHEFESKGSAEKAANPGDSSGESPS